MIINNQSLFDVTGLYCNSDFICHYFGMSNATQKDTISFIDTEKFIDEINNNNNITTVIVTKTLAKSIQKKNIIISEDPRYDFYIFYNAYGESNKVVFKSVISPEAQIHPRAFVSEHNVIIGANTFIGPNASILEDVEIGKNCYVKAGAVIGSEGFELKRTLKGILNVYHDGKVLIGDNVKIGANCAIHKGFSFKNTIIDNDVKIDDLVYIAHGAKIGEGCFLIGKSMLCGSVTLGKNIWIGPNSVISSGIKIGDNANITIGSVVTKDVDSGVRVTGNFAIDHEKFIDFIKSIS